MVVIELEVIMVMACVIVGVVVIAGYHGYWKLSWLWRLFIIVGVVVGYRGYGGYWKLSWLWQLFNCL